MFYFCLFNQNLFLFPLCLRSACWLPMVGIHDFDVLSLNHVKMKYKIRSFFCKLSLCAWIHVAIAVIWYAKMYFFFFLFLKMCKCMKQIVRFTSTITLNRIVWMHTFSWLLVAKCMTLLNTMMWTCSLRPMCACLSILCGVARAHIVNRWHDVCRIWIE